MRTIIASPSFSDANKLYQNFSQVSDYLIGFLCKFGLNRFVIRVVSFIKYQHESGYICYCANLSCNCNHLFIWDKNKFDPLSHPE